MKLPVLVLPLLTILLFAACTEGHFRWLFGRHRHRHGDLSFDDLARVVMSKGFRDNLEKTGSQTGEYIWKGHKTCRKFTFSGEMPEVYKKRPSFYHFFACARSDNNMNCTLSKGNKQFSMVVECCPGFTRSRYHPGCEAISSETVLEAAENIGLTKFVEAVETVGLAKKVEAGNFTIFAPENDAFNLDSDLIDSGDGLVLRGNNVTAVTNMDVERTISKFQHALLSHVIPGFHESGDLNDEEVLGTISPDRSTIRINFYVHPQLHEKLMTANCVPVKTKNVKAANGVVFSVEKHLSVVNETILDIVRSRPELSTLYKIMASISFVSTLQDDGQLTLLAPTDAAFDRMSPGLRKRIMSGDEQFLEQILKNHLLPNVICSAAIPEKAKTKNLLDHRLLVEKSEDKKIFINGAQLIKADMMATNGVVHIMDDALIPDDALDFLDLLEEKGYIDFLGIVDMAGLTETFRKMSNVTVFVPTNDALQSFQNIPMSVQKKIDKEFLRNLLLYHVSEGLNDLGQHDIFGEDSVVLPTKAQKEIRINYYDGFGFYMLGYAFKKSDTSAQCVPITHKNMKASNGRVNIIDGIMLPPEGSLIEILSSDKRFSQFYSLMKAAGVAEMIHSNGTNEKVYTIFAPNNDAFDKIDPRILDEMKQDPDWLRNSLLRHILKGSNCYGDYDLNRKMMQLGYTLNSNLYMMSYEDKQISFGKANVIKYDRTATDGNLVEIDYPVMVDY